MKINLLPKTASGKWAAILSIAFIILISLKILFPLPLPTFFIAVLGLSGFIAAIIQLIKKDFALSALLSILVGLVIIIWTTAEIIYPH